MKQTDLDRQEALYRELRLHTQRLELEAIAYRNVCAMCSASLLVSWNGQKDTFEVLCGKDRTHKGYVRLKSLYQKWRDGEALPVEVSQAMEHKYGKGRRK